MSNVGTFKTTVGVENMARRGQIEELHDVLVDTGAEATWIPRAILESLAIMPERRERFQLADGRILERDVGFAVVHVAGISTADDVVFAEVGDLVLLGARSMEGLNLRVDPRRKQLVSAGPIITGAVQV
jgi:clan AA aspartic protease